MQTKKLLPGYLFLASDDPTQLTEQCKKNHMLAKNDELILLNDQDMGLFSLTKNGIFELSKGIISGPLMGKKSEIKKNDRHKRKAWVSVNPASLIKPNFPSCSTTAQPFQKSVAEEKESFVSS